jgi:hypothetical protein
MAFEFENPLEDCYQDTTMVRLNANDGFAQSAGRQVPEAEIAEVPDRMARTSQAEYPGSRRKAIGISSTASPEDWGVLQR